MENSKLDIVKLLAKGGNHDERIFHKQIVNVYEFYLTGEIEEPEQYIEWFNIIRHATENDVIKIYINSPGGRIFTAVQFMRALSDTQASVVMSVEGECASAATMIFLCGDSFEVSDHSIFMIHTYSAGLLGKGNELHSRMTFEREWSVNLIEEVYKDFLTPEEITKVIDGTDIWINGIDVIERLKKLKEIREAEEKVQDQETTEE